MVDQRRDQKNTERDTERDRKNHRFNEVTVMIVPGAIVGSETRRTPKGGVRCLTRMPDAG
jgi:hypothetical protein